MRMEIIINNHMVGGAVCPRCQKWEGVEYISSIVNWLENSPTCHACLGCTKCNHRWLTGEWEVKPIED